MLVLSRKPGEAIKIDDDITITVVRISGVQVKIGIDAPKSVTIMRPEVEKTPNTIEENDNGN